MNHPDYKLNLRSPGTPRGIEKKMELALATGDLKYKWTGCGGGGNSLD